MEQELTVKRLTLRITFRTIVSKKKKKKKVLDSFSIMIRIQRYFSNLQIYAFAYMQISVSTNR